MQITSGSSVLNKKCHQSQTKLKQNFTLHVCERESLLIFIPPGCATGLTSSLLQQPLALSVWP